MAKIKIRTQTSKGIDENNFNYLLQNAIDEPSVMTDSVTIGDQTIGYAGLKTKVTMTITRDGSNVTIHELVTSIENPEMSYERTVTFEATEGELFLTLTVEGGYLKINGVESK